jgi:hypothetical protein
MNQNEQIQNSQSNRCKYEDIPSTSRGVDEVGTRRPPRDDPVNTGTIIRVEERMEEEVAVCKSRRVQNFRRQYGDVTRAQAALDEVIIELLYQEYPRFVRPGFWSCSRDAFISILRETDNEFLVDEWIQGFLIQYPTAEEDGLIHVAVVILLAKEFKRLFNLDISVYHVVDRIPYIFREDADAWEIVKSFDSGFGVWLESEHYYAVRITNISALGFGMIESTDDEVSELPNDSEDSDWEETSTSESYSGSDLDDTSCSVSESHACNARRECNSRCVFDEEYRDRYRKRSRPVSVNVHTLPLEWVTETPLENSQPRTIQVDKREVSDCVRRAFKLLAASGKRTCERASCVERSIDSPDPTNLWLKLVKDEINIARLDQWTYGTSVRGLLTMLNLFTQDGFQVCATFQVGNQRFLLRPGKGTVASLVSRLDPRDVPLGYVLWCEKNHCTLRLFTASEMQINQSLYKKQKYGFLVDVLAASATSVIAGLGIMIGGSGVAKL